MLTPLQNYIADDQYDVIFTKFYKIRENVSLKSRPIFKL